MSEQVTELTAVPTTLRDELIAGGEDPQVVDAAIAAMQALAELEWCAFSSTNKSIP
jgi:uncharacterized protein YqfA (UPF0365 family)